MGKNVTLLNQCFNLMGYLYQGKQIIVNHVNKMNVALNENIDDIITCEICTNLIDIRDGIAAGPLTRPECIDLLRFLCTS